MNANCTIHIADLTNPASAAALIVCINAYRADPMGGCQLEMSAETSARMVRGLQHLSTSVVFLAWQGPTPVGAAVCFRGFSTFAAQPLLNIHDIIVAPHMRRRGVGSCLMNAVEDHARDSGCCKITLEVRTDNSAAQSLYAQRNFSSGPPPMAFWTKSLQEDDRLALGAQIRL